jgi:hypothetical protein
MSASLALASARDIGDDVAADSHLILKRVLDDVDVCGAKLVAAVNEPRQAITETRELHPLALDVRAACGSVRPQIVQQFMPRRRRARILIISHQIHFLDRGFEFDPA